ncbi:MAG: DUF721 domain-containing protein [Deltaproteobacteria bacterium]|nr:DUF721 domain-containing protein [Candidatus Tharpella sp.]
MAKKYFRPVLSKAKKLRRKQPVVAVGDVVGRVLDTPGLRQRLLHEDIFRQWRKVVGGGLIDKCQPTRIKRHILYIDVKSSSWAHQLIYLQEEIINRVNELAGVTLIAAIHCRAVKAGRLKTVSGSVEKGEKLQFGSLVSEAEEFSWRKQTETLVKDHELVEILCRMRCHCEVRQRLVERS